MRIPSDQDASGRTLGEEELRLLAEVIRSGTLTSTRGTLVKRLEERMSGLLRAQRAVACASGTAAIHAALASVESEPGDEVITSPVTDMGAITPILYQAAVPVFADVDPRTGNLTAGTIASCISPRTRAVIVTHLFGNPCAMGPIRTLAQRHRLVLIEDCAQAFLARSQGELLGTIGSIGCFSLQQGKHATCGEGGLVVTDDQALGDRIALFVNKGWDAASAKPDHRFLALNYRMSELQGAVALAQLDKLEAGVRKRISVAEGLTRRLGAHEHLSPPEVRPGDVRTYWRYPVTVDRSGIPGGPAAVAAELRRDGIPSVPGYLPRPAFDCEVIRSQRTFGQSRFPFSLARPEALDYSPERFPGTFQLLSELLVLPWTERHDDAHAEMLATCLAGAAHRAAAS